MTKKIILLVFFFLILMATGSHAFIVTGRVTSNIDLPKPVTVYFKTEKEVFQVETDETGFFKIDLKEDLYFVTAEAYKDKFFYRGVSGRNPILINKNEHIGIKLFPVKKIKIQKIKSAMPVIECKLIYENKPVKDGRVYFYLKANDLKGMPYYYSSPTDQNGKVKLKEIIEGSYFVVARKKDDNNPLGPLMEGDLIGFLSEVPFYFKSGYSYSFDINLFKKVRDEAPSVSTKHDIIYIVGKAVDKNGNPIAGLYAFAYDKNIIGHERPISISNRTDKDGVFKLPIPGKGKYYLGVREFYGGTPVQGEYYGLYSGTYDHHINIEDNMDNILITVEKILK